jgi:Synergist-CTERM protein sorting domain-containing protein
MLDGWRITGVNPTSSRHWRANISNGNLVVTFHGESSNQIVKVTLVNDVTSETMELEIKFSGESDSGCNAGFTPLALFGLFPMFMRRKR